MLRELLTFKTPRHFCQRH